MKIGLRIDVDTFRGTRDGVPDLCRILADNSIQATFFFCVGPDNMGRHLRRLIRPRFLLKMLRTNASGLYGWDILLRGTFWPGPIIGKKLGYIIKAAADSGHEIGFHAWDHYAWQTGIESLSKETIHNHLRQGVEMLTEIIGAQPTCSAVPGWKCTEQVLIEKERFPFIFNSDCRGTTIFRPTVNGSAMSQPQVPVTLPTYDEIIGRNGLTDEKFNDKLISLLHPKRLNVLTVHAEVEGILCKGMFRAFIEKAQSLGHEFTTLGSLLSMASSIPDGTIEKGHINGRPGWVATSNIPEI